MKNVIIIGAGNGKWILDFDKWLIENYNRELECMQNVSLNM